MDVPLLRVTRETNYAPPAVAGDSEARTRARSIAVVICTRNRPQELEACLAAVSTLVYPRYEVLVVDNASVNHRSREIAERWRVHYLYEPRAGLSNARNAGVKTCRADIVAFIDDDARPDPDWLAALAPEFQKPNVMAVAGRVVALGVETDKGRNIERLAKNPETSRMRRQFDRTTESWFEDTNFGAIGTGNNMAFRREVFDNWPGFHPWLGRGAIIDGSEEHFAFFELIEKGFSVVYCPKAVVRHPYPRTNSDISKAYLRNVTAAVGYCAFLFRYEPTHRGELIRWALCRSRRKRSNDDSLSNRSGLPRWRIPFALLGGILLAGRILLKPRLGQSASP